jgi:hypothetical protein
MRRAARFSLRNRGQVRELGMELGGFGQEKKERERKYSARTGRGARFLHGAHIG